MSATDELQDILATHQAYLEFYSNGFIRTLQRKVASLERNLRGDLSLYEDVRSSGATKTELKRNIKQTLDEFDEDVRELVENEMRNFTKVENEFYSGQFDSIFDGTDVKVNKESTDDTYGVVEKEKIAFENGEAYTLLAFLLKFFRDNRNRIEQQIENSLILDDDEASIRDKIVGPAGQTHISAVRAAAVAVTLITFFSSKVRERNLKLNEDKIKGYQWVSVIDSRTSSFCRWADGKTWFYDSDEGTLGSPYTPPAHNRCRSTTTPILKSWDELGLDSSYSNVFTGEAPQRTTYYEWLSRQPAAVQRDVLGDTRYALWKKEGIAPERFYNRNGKYLTLDQLKQKNIEIPKEYLKYVRGD